MLYVIDPPKIISQVELVICEYEIISSMYMLPFSIKKA